MAHGQNIVARLQHATKNATATLMLMRLNHWIGKPVAVQHEGETWVANSTEEWGEDSGLTPTQAKYAGEQLRKMNLMKTTMRWHRKRWIMHATLTPRARAIIAGVEDECLSDEGMEAPQCGAPAPALIGEQIESKKEKQIEKGSETLPKGSVTHSETIVVKQVSGEIEQDTETMKMSDVMKAQAGKKHLHKPDSVPALEFLWKQKLSEESDAMIVLKAKEYGQLKLFQKQCPEGAALQVLEWVLDNWNTFSKGVMAEADLKSTPASPLLGFILQWSAQAVIGWTQSTKIAEPQNPMKQEAPIAVPASKPLQLISPKQDYPDSIEEIMG